MPVPILQIQQPETRYKALYGAHHPSIIRSRIRPARVVGLIKSATNSSFIAVLLLLCLAWHSIPASAAQRPLTEWPVPVLKHLKEVRDDPQQVLDTILPQLDQEHSLLHLAGLHFVASRAYSSLMLHEKALQKSNAGLTLVEKDAQPWLHAYLQLARAEALKGLGRAREGEMQVTDAIKWAQHNQSFELLAYAFSVAGYMSLTLSETDEALAKFQAGYRLAEREALRIRPQDFSGMIALVYEYRDEPSLAIPYFEAAQQYYRQSNLRLELANTLFGLGRSHLKLNNRQKGLRLLIESARLAIDIRDIQGAAYSYQQISEQLIERGDLAEARTYLDDALRLFREANNPYQQIGVLLLQARIALITAENEQAMELIRSAGEIAQGDAFLPHQIQINNLKAEVLAARGDFEDAYLLLLTMMEDDQRLQREKNSQRLIKLKTAFETEKQRAQNALLQEQNLRQQAELEQEREQQQYMAIVAFLLIIISLLLFWQHRISKRHHRRLENLANHDGLTGLLTRRKTLEDIDQQLHLAHRHNDYISLAILDLDFFKQINDQYGHQAGDDILKGFASLARQTFRGTDILGRIGGEEFLFAFPHTSLEDARKLLARFAESVKNVPALIDREQITLSVSIGLVSGEHSQSGSALMAMADEALYAAKEAGRDRICLYRHPARSQ